MDGGGCCLGVARSLETFINQIRTCNFLSLYEGIGLVIGRDTLDIVSAQTTMVSVWWHVSTGVHTEGQALGEKSSSIASPCCIAVLICLAQAQALHRSARSKSRTWIVCANFVSPKIDYLLGRA